MGKIDFKHALFYGLGDWLSYAKKAVTRFAIGLLMIVYAVIMGVVTIFYNVFLIAKRFVLKYPVHVLSFLCVTLCVLLLFNFVSYSKRIKTYEYQRDSIGYELQKIEQALGGDTIIIGVKNKTVNPYDTAKNYIAY